jgi:hypothetical protein
MNTNDIKNIEMDAQENIDEQVKHCDEIITLIRFGFVRKPFHQ